MMRPELLAVLAYTAGMLKAGIPLVDAWEIQLVDESDPATVNFLQRLLDNWMNLPYDQGIRVTPSVEQTFSSEELKILGPMTYVGEATGMLDSLWPGAIALLLIQAKVSKTAEDDELVRSLAFVFPDQTGVAEPEYDGERIPRWFRNHQKKTVPLKESVVKKLVEVGEMSGCREHVDDWKAYIQNILGCIQS